jgi:hypothetical protein
MEAGEMTTIPLAPVFAFLARHNAADALDGAPLLYDRMGPRLKAIDPVFLERLADGIISDTHSLYLGDGDVCPAALGWATSMLTAARGVHIDIIEVSRDAVRGWVAGDGFAVFAEAEGRHNRGRRQAALYE